MSVWDALPDQIRDFDGRLARQQGARRWLHSISTAAWFHWKFPDGVGRAEHSETSTVWKFLVHGSFFIAHFGLITQSGCVARAHSPANI